MLERRKDADYCHLPMVRKCQFPQHFLTDIPEPGEAETMSNLSLVSRDCLQAEL